MTPVDNFGHPINARDVGAPTPMPPPPETSPEPQDALVAYREDHIQNALNRALQVAIRNHLKFLGNDVKSVCWDVREEFERALKNV